MINIIHNFLPEVEKEKVCEECYKASYSNLIIDATNTSPTGIVSVPENGSYIYNLFTKKLSEDFPFINDLKLQRIFINCFFPGEVPHFHVDGEGYTFLYYANPEYKGINEGGETQFIINEKTNTNDKIKTIRGILPIPNSLVVFDASLNHRATSFKTQRRFTIAITYIK